MSDKKEFEIRIFIENLEERIHQLENELQKYAEHLKTYHELMLGACPFDIEKTIRENMKGKIPHKCPICDGLGRHYVDPNRPLSGIENAFMPKDERGFQYRICQACKSSGIIWG